MKLPKLKFLGMVHITKLIKDIIHYKVIWYKRETDFILKTIFSEIKI